MNRLSAFDRGRGGPWPRSAFIHAVLLSYPIARRVNVTGAKRFGTLDIPPIRRRGRRGGAGQPAPPFLRLTTMCKPNPVERRSSPALNGSGPRLCLQPKARMPGGVGQPTPPPPQSKSCDLASFVSSRRVALAGCEVVDDDVTDASSAARGGRWAVSASLSHGCTCMARRP